MLILCPGCRTKYSIDGQRVGTEGITLRCGKCKTNFRAARKSREPDATPPMKDPPDERRGIRVVVANESEAFCNAVRDVLAPEPVEVHAFHDGREAFDSIVRMKPDVVLLDVALPSMYGFEVCEAIRRMPELTSVKIILIASIYDKTKYKRAPVSLYGADDYIEKHHIPDSLAAMVYRLVSGQQPVESLADQVGEGEDEAQTATQKLSPGEREEQEFTRLELKRDEESETSSPSPRSRPELSEAQVKARRLARIIVSDIVLYNQARVEEGVKKGTFYQLLADEIAEGKAIYLSRVPGDVIQGTSFLEEAFAELINSEKLELGL